MPLNGNGKKTRTRRHRRPTTIKKAVRNELSKLAEHKFFDHEVLATNMTTTWEIEHISDIPQGDQSSERDGDYIHLDSIAVHATVTGVAADITNFCRLIIFTDKQSDGADPGATAVFDLSVASDFICFTNNINKGRFRILKDWMVSLSAEGPASANMSWYKKLDLKVSMAAGAITPFQNAVFIAFVSDSGATNYPALNLVSRIRYTDI